MLFSLCSFILQEDIFFDHQTECDPYIRTNPKKKHAIARVQMKRSKASRSPCMGGTMFDGVIAWQYLGRRGIILLIVPQALSPSAVVISGVLLVLPGCMLTQLSKKSFMLHCIIQICHFVTLTNPYIHDRIFDIRQKEYQMVVIR